MFDTHVHTKFSTDSAMHIEEAIERASKLNMGLIITDHMDTNFPGKEKFNFNCDEFFLEYGSLRDEKLLLGIELGMTLEFMDENKALVERYPFDYVIGSIHFLGNYDIYYSDVYEGKTRKEVFEQYFTAMIDNICVHSYIDSLAHMDYISRYAAYEDKEIHYRQFSEHIDEVLKSVIDKNIALEINSRRLGDNLAVKNMRKIYHRYKELGGQLVTIGSDAHGKDAIGANFQAAVDIVKDFGLKLVYYKERKPVFISLN